MANADKKERAARAALDCVSSGMVVGLGTGSTAALFVRALAERVADGLDIVGVPTSQATEALAQELNVPLAEIDETLDIDLVVDGADEADPKLRLIKGGGAALLREKIIADAARRMIVIADDSKLVGTLGAFPLPVEVTPFAWPLTVRRIRSVLRDLDLADAAVSLRADPQGGALLSDGGNYIVDCACKRIAHPEQLAAGLSRIPGVVEHGLFLDQADIVLAGGETGVERLMGRAH